MKTKRIKLTEEQKKTQAKADEFEEGYQTIIKDIKKKSPEVALLLDETYHNKARRASSVVLYLVLTALEPAKKDDSAKAEIEKQVKAAKAEMQKELKTANIQLTKEIKALKTELSKEIQTLKKAK